MSKVLVVADDMTGANDTGALFSKNGFPAATVLRPELSRRLREEKMVLCISTDTRAAEPEHAREAVRKAVERYGDSGMLICKRIDSTLRGNVGSEIDGMLDALPEGWRAAVVPSCPGAGRICVGGHVLVHGVALARSGAASDRKTPVCFSKVEDIIRRQSRRSCELFCLQDIQEDRERTAERIRRSGAEILVFDAATQEDIQRIADLCQMSGVPVACVDPGDFSVAMAHRKFSDSGIRMRTGSSLLVIGSISEVTRRQVAYLQKKRQMKLCTVKIRELLDHSEGEKNRILREAGPLPEFFCLITEPVPLKLNCREAEEAARRLAEIGLAVLELRRTEIRCAYLSGGDVAKYFLELLEPEALDLIDEVAPLAVYGKAVGGMWDGLQILTKGGMIGEEDTLDRMLRYAEQKRSEGIIKGRIP